MWVKSRPWIIIRRKSPNEATHDYCLAYERRRRRLPKGEGEDRGGSALRKRLQSIIQLLISNWLSAIHCIVNVPPMPQL